MPVTDAQSLVDLSVMGGNACNRRIDLCGSISGFSARPDFVFIIDTGAVRVMVRKSLFSGMDGDALQVAGGGGGPAVGLRDEVVE